MSTPRAGGVFHAGAARERLRCVRPELGSRPAPVGGRGPSSGVLPAMPQRFPESLAALTSGKLPGSRSKQRVPRRFGWEGSSFRPRALVVAAAVLPAACGQIRGRRGTQPPPTTTAIVARTAPPEELSEIEDQSTQDSTVDSTDTATRETERKTRRPAPARNSKRGWTRRACPRPLKSGCRPAPTSAAGRASCPMARRWSRHRVVRRSPDRKEEFIGAVVLRCGCGS